MITTVKAQCPTCRGTGLSGIPSDEVMLERDAEIAGDNGLAAEAVVCDTCEGSGCKKISFVPFNGRKMLSHIKKVFPRRGGEAMTYSEFIKATLYGGKTS